MRLGADEDCGSCRAPRGACAGSRAVCRVRARCDGERMDGVAERRRAGAEWWKECEAQEKGSAQSLASVRLGTTGARRGSRAAASRSARRDGDGHRQPRGNPTSPLLSQSSSLDGTAETRKERQRRCDLTDGKQLRETERMQGATRAPLFSSSSPILWRALNREASLRRLLDVPLDVPCLLDQLGQACESARAFSVTSTAGTSSASGS